MVHQANYGVSNYMCFTILGALGSSACLSDAPIFASLRNTNVVIFEGTWTSHRISSSILAILLQHVGYSVSHVQFSGLEDSLARLARQGNREAMVNIEAWAGADVESLARQYNEHVVGGKIIDLGFAGYSGRLGFYEAGNCTAQCSGQPFVLGSLLTPSSVETALRDNAMNGTIQQVDETILSGRILELLDAFGSVVTVSWDLSAATHVSVKNSGSGVGVQLRRLVLDVDFDRQLPLKIVSRDLKLVAPLAYSIVESFNLDSAVMQSLVAAAVSKDPYQVACDWIYSHRWTWERWLKVPQAGKIVLVPLWLVGVFLVVVIFIVAFLWETFWITSTGNAAKYPLFVCSSNWLSGLLRWQRSVPKKDTPCEISSADKTLAADALKRRSKYSRLRASMRFSSRTYYADEDGKVNIGVFRWGEELNEIEICIDAEVDKATFAKTVEHGWTTRNSDKNRIFRNVEFKRGQWIINFTLQLESSFTWSPHCVARLMLSDGDNVEYAVVLMTRSEPFPSKRACDLVMDGLKPGTRTVVIRDFLNYFRRTRDDKAQRTANAMIFISLHRVAVAALIPKILVDDVISPKVDMTWRSRHLCIFILGAVWLVSFSLQRYADVIQLADRGRTTCREFLRNSFRDAYLACSEQAQPAEVSVFMSLATFHADIIAKEVWFPVFKLLQSVANLMCGASVVLFLFLRGLQESRGNIVGGLGAALLIGMSMLPLTLLWLWKRWDQYFALTYVRSWTQSRWISEIDQLENLRRIDHDISPPGWPKRGTFKKRYQDFTAKHRAQRRFQLDSSYAALWIANLCIIALLVLAGIDMLFLEHFGVGNISVGLFYAMLKLSLRAGKDVYLIANHLLTISRGSISLIQAITILNVKTDVVQRSRILDETLKQLFPSEGRIVNPPRSLLDLCKSIEFSGAQCSETPDVFSMTIPLGCFASVTSTSGLSAFMKMACGLRFPDSGSVLIPPYARYAFVPSEPAIYATTRNNNLLLFKKHTRCRYTPEELGALRVLFGLPRLIEGEDAREAKRERFLDLDLDKLSESNTELHKKIVSEMPEHEEGYKEEGLRMPRSQRLRVSLLRAILTDPDVLCVDSSLGTIDCVHRKQLQLLVCVWHQVGVLGLLHLATSGTAEFPESLIEASQRFRLPRTVIWARENNPDLEVCTSCIDLQSRNAPVKENMFPHTKLTLDWVRRELCGVFEFEGHGDSVFYI